MPNACQDGGISRKDSMKAPGFVSACLWLAVLLMLLAGCGKKLPPVPRGRTAAEMPSCKPTCALTLPV